MVSPLATSCCTNLYASLRRVTVCCRSMIWMPLRSIKMNGFILGFQRRGLGSKGRPAFQKRLFGIMFAEKKNSSPLQHIGRKEPPPALPPRSVGVFFLLMSSLKYDMV